MLVESIATLDQTKGRTAGEELNKSPRRGSQRTDGDVAVTNGGRTHT